MYENLYEPFRIGSLTVKNRLVASAMFESGGADGALTPKIYQHYKTLAQGGVGLIITGMHAVRKGGCTSPLMVNIQDPQYVPELRRIADAVHENGCRLFVQLQHCGVKTFHGEGYDHIGVCDETAPDGWEFHAATEAELHQLAQDFAAAALRCREAGADGVQIHGAHGYLLSTFLSPATNHRTDRYGGPMENRARLLFEIYDAIREAVGPDYPICTKFPFSDLRQPSTTPEEALYACKTLADKGIDMIEVSSGMVLDGSAHSFSPFFPHGEETPFRSSAALLAEQVSIPVVSVCGYRTPGRVSETLASTAITAVSFGRPLVCEPDLPNRWKTDDSPARCVSCNGCCKSYLHGILTCRLNLPKASV